MTKEWKSGDILKIINLYYAKVSISQIAARFKVTEQSVGKLLKRHLPLYRAERKETFTRTPKFFKKRCQQILTLKDAFFWMQRNGLPVTTKDYRSFLVSNSAVPLTREQFVLKFNECRLLKGLPIVHVKEVTDGGF